MHAKLIVFLIPILGLVSADDHNATATPEGLTCDQCLNTMSLAKQRAFSKIFKFCELPLISSRSESCISTLAAMHPIAKVDEEINCFAVGVCPTNERIDALLTQPGDWYDATACNKCAVEVEFARKSIRSSNGVDNGILSFVHAKYWQLFLSILRLKPLGSEPEGPVKMSQYIDHLADYEMDLPHRLAYCHSMDYCGKH